MKKRIYIKPFVDLVELDKMVTLIMTSLYTPPNPDDPYGTSGSAQSAPIEEEQSVKKNAFTDSPFGETFE